jgi:hypothetical protein
MKLAPALVPLEAWFWYMLFLDLLSTKFGLGFLIELIEQILHTNYYAISCKILMCALDQNYLFHVYSNGKTFYNFLINTA